VKEVMQSWFNALRGAPLWKKPLLIIAFPFLVVGAWALWRAEDRMEQSRLQQEQEEQGGLPDSIEE